MHPVASENRYGTGWREAPHKQACEGGPIIDIHRRLLIKNNRLIFIIKSCMLVPNFTPWRKLGINNVLNQENPPAAMSAKAVTLTAKCFSLKIRLPERTDHNTSIERLADVMTEAGAKA